MKRQLRVFSLFSSLQGESSRLGLPCFFIRLAGCPLNCFYCDTQEARSRTAGELMSLGEILRRAEASKIGLVEVTGGEPLYQDSTMDVLTALCDKDFEVLLETSGAYPIEDVDKRVRIVMDVKTPGSGMDDRFCLDNLKHLCPGQHELKFVISSKEDFNWCVSFIRQHGLDKGLEILISPLGSFLDYGDVARWIMDCGLSLRMQLQLHKIIWPNSEVER